MMGGVPRSPTVTGADRQRESERAPEPGSLLPDKYNAAAGMPDGSRPTKGAHRRGGRRRWRFVLVGPTVVLGLFLWSVAAAVTTPGNQSFSAKWTDWVRAHGGAGVVSAAENFYYNINAPAKGGRPKSLNTLPSTNGFGAAPGASSGRHNGHASTVPAHLPAPNPVPLVVSPALKGEGQWQPVGARVDGIPGMYEAQFRADNVYTSEITTAVWIDPKLLKVSSVPGQSEPGGKWSHPPFITQAERSSVLAAFNGGFRFQDARGGFYLDGRTAVPLRRGAASLVIYKNGRINIGSWGTEVRMTPGVASVLQNLIPMVDHGEVSTTATYNDASIWGQTLGAATVVARSGVGITRNGALVYVAGPALTARTLAESLQRAGAVRAMTLDINPEWVTFNFFGHRDRHNLSKVTPASLYPQMQRPDTRYLGPTQEARDFFTVSLPSTSSLSASSRSVSSRSTSAGSASTGHT